MDKKRETFELFCTYSIPLVRYEDTYQNQSVHYQWLGYKAAWQARQHEIDALQARIEQLERERDAYKEEWNGGNITTPRSELLEKIKHLELANEWVDVKNNLPEDHFPVLIRDEFFSYCVASHYLFGWSPVNDLLSAENYDGGACITMCRNPGITHWMPLPKAPH